MVTSVEELKKEIEKRLSEYPKEDFEIEGKSYSMYVFNENKNLNIFEGFLFKEISDKQELKDLLNYKRPTGYTIRIGVYIYNGDLIIKDYFFKKQIRKTISKINKLFLKKFRKALEEPKEENISALFDRTDVIEEFYVLYRKSREFLLKKIKGISEEEKRKEFIDNFMMQMLTLWYLQEKGFFNNDRKYLINAFKEYKNKGFQSFYEFLNYLFDKISGISDDQYVKDEKIGECVVIGPAIFLNGEEQQRKEIEIPDECFYQEGLTEELINLSPKGSRRTLKESDIKSNIPLLNLFESRDWTEGNIDEFVLGAIFEKLMNYDERKQTAAYYTPEEITSYICENTIKPYLLDRINEKFKREFKSIEKAIEEGNQDILEFIFKQLQDIKILDPACGSGHFLEDAIEVLVDVYKKLWQKAKELNLKGKFVIKAANEKGEIEDIDLVEITDEEKFTLLVKFFIILSRNIYGVDINPAAIKVARARLFLTLAKHFKAELEKDIFIRFPNVHFNLREGNSLIGYVELKRKSRLFDFSTKEEKVSYITKKIQVVAELKEYLERISKSLNLDGNVVEEIEKLNEILSKRKIDREDFEKVLKTKEKLIGILIASLNSKYAKPLNDLLREITDFFNQKLDEKFAEENNIDLEKLKSAESIPWERKMFHWIFEFPEVFLGSRGFDVVIGNPPYIMEVRDNKELFSIYRESPIGKKYYEQKMDLFYFFIERGIDLLKNRGLLGYIVQEYWLTREHAKKLRKKVFAETTPIEFILFKEFSVFKDAPGQHNMILILKKERKKGEVRIKILRNLVDEKTIYRSMYCDSTNEVFEVFKQCSDSIYNAQTDTVELVGGLKGRIWNEIHKRAIRLDSKEIQQGVVTPQHFVINEHLQKVGDYRFRLGEGIFVLSDEEYKSYNWTKDELQIIKPFFFTKELDKYYFPLENKYWLIYTDKKAKKDIENNPEKYPNIRKHLDRFKEIITSDNKPYGLHRPRQPKWFESKNKIVGVRKTKYPKFVVVPVPFYTDQSAIIIIPKRQYGVSPFYFAALLNSTLAHWIFFNLKTQGRQLQIDKAVIEKFPFKIKKEFSVLEVLSKYLHFLKQYQYYFSEKNKYLQYIINYFDNLIDSLVYELYFEGIINISIKELVENKLENIELPNNLLEIPQEEREKIFEKIENVFQKLKNDKQLNENLDLIKLHPWVKAICTSLEG